MPLEEGTIGSAAFKHNIKTEIAAGKPQKQAVAIAYQMAGERRGDALALDCGKWDAVINATMAVERRMRLYKRAGMMMRAGRNRTIRAMRMVSFPVPAAGQAPVSENRQRPSMASACNRMEVRFRSISQS